MWQLSFLVIFFLKLLIFRLVKTYFGTPQIAPDHTIFVEKNSGEHAPGPPSKCVRTQCYRATYTPAILLSF